jgi:riboflavin synthase
MFTGLVRAIATVSDVRPSGRGGVEVEIEHGSELGRRLDVGASLAVAGVCLTVTSSTADRSRSWVELSPETLRRTTFGGLAVGRSVNLEPSLALGDALGGHWVQGHVDGVTEVVERRDLEEHRELELALAPEWQAWVVEKGSVAIDGVSLTIASLGPDRFGVALIPHTLEVTTLGSLAVGDRAHFEADILGKYAARALDLRFGAT